MTISIQVSIFFIVLLSSIEMSFGPLAVPARRGIEGMDRDRA